MKKLLGGVLALLLLSSTAKADIIFNTFGPGDSYNTGVGWTLGVPGLYQDVGLAFTPAGNTYTLDRLVLALGWVTGTNAVDVSLMTAVGGLPGSVLETWHVTNLPTFGAGGPPITMDSVLHPFLEEGTQYFVVSSVPLGESTWAAWNWNIAGTIGPLAYRQNGGAWSAFTDVQTALRAEGSPVPEPSTLSLLSLGVVSLLARRWRRCRADCGGVRNTANE
jgi:hypothetical protein